MGDLDGWQAEIAALAPVVGDAEWIQWHGAAIICRDFGIEVRRGEGQYRVYVDHWHELAVDISALPRVVSGLIAAWETYRAAMEGRPSPLRSRIDEILGQLEREQAAEEKDSTMSGEGYFMGRADGLGRALSEIEHALEPECAARGGDHG